MTSPLNIHDLQDYVTCNLACFPFFSVQRERKGEGGKKECLIHTLRSSRKYLILPRKAFCFVPPHPSGNSSLASYFSSKRLAFKTPLPQEFQMTFCGGSMDIFFGTTHLLFIYLFIIIQRCQNVPAAGNFAAFSPFLATYSTLNFTI